MTSVNEFEYPEIKDEEIVIYSLIYNKDGSITIEALINIYLEKGMYSTHIKTRLKK